MRLLLGTLLSISACQATHAQLVLNVDTAVARLWFTGSDFVEPNPPPGGVLAFEMARWGDSYEASDDSVFTFPAFDLIEASDFESDPGGPVGSGGHFSDEGTFSVFLLSFGGRAYTVTGRGPASSLFYGDLFDNASGVELGDALISKGSLQFSGVMGSDIAVIAATIPEPSTLLQVLCVALVVGSLWLCR
ncbi:MAG: hypothetical protein KDA44_13455 [Planctomycetales bacterium]|nr:hypothetical protein [Planctomycetales bacterium]